MESISIKCSQCGSTHVEKIGSNKYRCPYCGYTFSTSQKATGFTDINKSEYEIRKEIARQEADRKETRNLILQIGGVIIGGLVLMMIVIAYADYEIKIRECQSLRDKDYKEVKFNSEFERIAFLETSSFKGKDYEISYKENATTVTVNGTDFESPKNCWEFGYRGVYIFTSPDNSSICLCRNDSILATRPADIPIKPYINFETIDEMRNYLCESDFVSGEDVLHFFNDAYAIQYNEQVLSTNCFLSSYYDGVKKFEGRGYVSYKDEIGEKRFYLYVDVYGENAYILDSYSMRKYTRIIK